MVAKFEPVRRPARGQAKFMKPRCEQEQSMGGADALHFYWSTGYDRSVEVKGIQPWRLPSPTFPKAHSTC
ncbi:hypothetical protein SBA3_4850004 [Candidatus Sulfopaludibacter sp. SbA3]|nr:hypothetical protein SBA3_4850004 [Candidatus Sulfopaludibacter sp. SbA3]